MLKAEILWQENCNWYRILLFLFFSILLKIFKKSINYSICLAPIINNQKIVLGHFLSSIDWPRAQDFCIHKTIQVIMVYEIKDLIFTTISIIIHDCQEFAIIGLITNLCPNHLFKKKIYWLLCKSRLISYLLASLQEGCLAWVNRQG